MNYFIFLYLFLFKHTQLNTQLMCNINKYTDNIIVKNKTIKNNGFDYRYINATDNATNNDNVTNIYTNIYSNFNKKKLLDILITNISLHDKLQHIDLYEKIDCIKKINITAGGLLTDWNNN